MIKFPTLVIRKPLPGGGGGLNLRTKQKYLIDYSFFWKMEKWKTDFVVHFLTVERGAGSVLVHSCFRSFQAI